jgi:hypothetical protein
MEQEAPTTAATDAPQPPLQNGIRPGRSDRPFARRRAARRGRHPFTQRDWVGDCVITIVLGVALLAGVVLPWANDRTGHLVNLSLTKPDTTRAALETSWGVAVLALGIAVFSLGVLLLTLGPRRLAAPCGAAISAAGLVVIVVAFRAAAAMAGYHAPGLGIYIDVLAGILLVPTGFAAAVVGSLLAADSRQAALDSPGPAAG